MSPSAARIVALGVLVALWGSGTSGAQTAAPTLGVLVDQVQALFPKVDGEVIEVQTGTVTLALGSRDGLVAGVELALYRQGRELRHPKTGEVLGRTEQQMGRLAVQQVFEAYSTGTVSPALFVPATTKPVAKGDYSAGGKRDSQTPNQQRSFLARLLYGELDAGTYSSGESAIPLKEVAKFPFLVASMDVAVGSKDKITRMVITDGERVFLYRITPERILEPEWTYRTDSRARVFAVQLAELSNDGAVHVVVNRYSQIPAILINSLILTTKDQKAVVSAEEITDILLSVDTNGEGVKKTLWSQSFVQTGFFKQGDATRVSLRNGKLVSEGRVRVPSGFRATGAVHSNIAGKGVRALAFIDELNRLRIAIDTQETFRSASPVGTGMAKLGVESQVERGGRTYIYYPEPMPLSVDLDGDGVEEIAVRQNQIPGRLAVVYKGPAGYRFQTVNSGFEGTVIALGAVPGDVTPTLVAAVVRYTNFRNTEGETQIIMTTSE